MKVKVKSFSHIWLFATLWTIAHLSPPSMGISRQEYWSGLLFPSPRDLPKPGIKLWSPTLWADSSSSEPPGNPGAWLHMAGKLPTTFSLALLRGGYLLARSFVGIRAPLEDRRRMVSTLFLGWKCKNPTNEEYWGQFCLPYTPPGSALPEHHLACSTDSFPSRSSPAQVH